MAKAHTDEETGEMEVDQVQFDGSLNGNNTAQEIAQDDDDEAVVRKLQPRYRPALISIISAVEKLDEADRNDVATELLLMGMEWTRTPGREKAGKGILEIAQALSYLRYSIK